MLIMLMTVLNIEPWQEHSLKMSSTSDAYSLSVINFQNLAKAYLFFREISCLVLWRKVIWQYHYILYKQITYKLSPGGVETWHASVLFTLVNGPLFSGRTCKHENLQVYNWEQD